jgi:dienelactone hydrolase
MRAKQENADKGYVEIETPDAVLEGNMLVPDNAPGIVLFAHGSGSSRFSPRNRAVAQDLRDAGFATLLFDLLTSEEDEIDRRTRHLRFDIELLADRLVGATDWISDRPEARGLGLAYFGSSTGAAAALVAVTRTEHPVQAIVSRGGRPDLASDALPEVQVPTLLIVGGKDRQVIGMNKEAMEKMEIEPVLEIVSGASHLFEEPGKLEEVAGLAGDFFQKHLHRRE